MSVAVDLVDVDVMPCMRPVEARGRRRDARASRRGRINRVAEIERHGWSVPSRGRSILAPLAERPQHQHGDDAHAERGDDRAEQRTRARVASSSIAVALQLDQRVADQPAGEPAEEDRHERGDSCLGWR